MTTPSSLPGVQLLVPSTRDEASIALSHEVIDELVHTFGLTDVVVRSVERLLLRNEPSTDHAGRERTMLQVLLGHVSKETVSILRQTSTHPILYLDSETSSSAAAKELSYEIAKWCSLTSPRIQQILRRVNKERRQASLVDDAQLQTRSPRYIHAIAQVYDFQQSIGGDIITQQLSKHLSIETKIGKVRNIYRTTNTITTTTTITESDSTNDQMLALVTTDRMSGFDRHLAMVPFKGAVLNLTSAYWFEQTKHIIPNHVVAVPHPYVTIAKQCQPFPIEFVVR
jgi:hypothetical protein